MLKIITRTFREFSNDKCSRMAAALAYYAAFSMAPLMILIISIAGLIWDRADVEWLLQSEFRTVFGEDGAQQLKVMLDSAKRSDRGLLASLVSGGLLLVGATGLVGQLQDSLNDTWEVQPDPESGGIRSFISKRLLSFGMICGIAFLLLVSLVMSSVLVAAGGVLARWMPGMSHYLLVVLNAVGSTAVIALLFSAMFKVLPDARIAWSDVAVGAVLTAVLFNVGKLALGIYLGSQNMEGAYGAAGSLMLILVWIYYSSMILFFGAEFTQVWARERGTGVRPSPGAVRVVTSTTMHRGSPV